MLRWIGYLFGVLLFCGLLAVGGALWLFWEFGRGLPDYSQLADYEPPVTTRVYAGDGSLLEEYAVQRRLFVPVEVIPELVKNAFIAAEDQHFYTHPGVDVVGVMRAAVTNLRNIGTGRRPEGASTITQQVAQNFLLAKEVSIQRKIREAILAFRMERTFTKDEILELYLNEIYLGLGSYGVASAALNYFGKSLDELTVDEAAYLAALPKAPNNYNPIRNRGAAIARRNYVLERMAQDGFVRRDEVAALKQRALVVDRAREEARTDAPYFAEDVRRQLIGTYGESALYGGGLSVRTSIDPHLQSIARKSLREGLVAYDRRHGWRGPVARLDGLSGWPVALSAVERPVGAEDWRLAAVLDVDDAGATIGFVDETSGRIPLSELKWAREPLPGQKLGPSVRSATAVLHAGDVVLVERVQKDAEGEDYPENSFGLRQVPAIEGSIVALDPHTGRVLAMTGGYSFQESEFNRATQAWRQPGSAFKPVVYMAALDQNFTPSTLILDAPFVIDQGPGQGKWKPANFSNTFYGPSPMRLGVEKSRNLMTVRLAQTIGIDKVAELAEQLRITDHLPRHLSMAIGAGETTLMRMVTAYAMIVNGGRRIEPSLIDRIQDRAGTTVFRHDRRACEACRGIAWQEQPPPELPDPRERVVDPATAYQMVSMLEGVVERGTGRRISTIGKPLAGKTGTTNDSFDTWFIGFTPDLVVGVFAGFDEPSTLGRDETGSSVAAPIFKAFMEAALEGKPAIPFRVPPGIRLVRVNPETGLIARPGERGAILEAFKAGNVPTRLGPVVDGGYDPGGGGISGRPTKGIY